MSSVFDATKGVLRTIDISLELPNSPDPKPPRRKSTIMARVRPVLHHPLVLFTNQRLSLAF